MVEENTVIEDLKRKKICDYCKKESSDLQWRSIHEGINHYKVANCPGCNSEFRIPVAPGSGHDDFVAKEKPKITGSVTSIDWFVMGKDSKDEAPVMQKVEKK